MKTMYPGRYLGVERCEFATGLDSHARTAASDATSSSSLKLPVRELPSTLNITERCTLAETRNVLGSRDWSMGRRRRSERGLRRKEGEEQGGINGNGLRRHRRYPSVSVYKFYRYL
jgi:hypothetical protein